MNDAASIITYTIIVLHSITRPPADELSHDTLMAKNLKAQCFVGPTTALLASKGKVLSGCGSELFVFDQATNELEAKIQLFCGSSIHGFREGQGAGDQILLCAFGAKQACVVSITIAQGKVKDITFKSAVIKTHDWIWDAHWVLDEDNTSSIALALAHNSVLLWDWISHKITKERKCKENCILYCAHLVGTMWQNLIFMAGTVFNQIVLWPIGNDKDHDINTNVEHQQAVEIMHSFSGHKGVIFSIQYHQEMKRLCSVSDDRSIRMWQLSFPKSNNTPPTISDWKQLDSHLIFSLYGHAARVWDVVMMSTCFASIGEDATCLIWDYHGNIIQKFKGHKGKSIWSLTASDDEMFVITGGGDASIRVWELQKSGKPVTVSSSVPLQRLTDSADFPRSIEMLDFNSILIMMNSGSFYIYDVSEQEFNLIFSDSSFKSYSVISPCHKQYLCAIGNIKGNLRIVNAKDKTDIKDKDITLFNGKILSLIWVTDFHLLCSGPNGHCILLNISDDDCGREGKKYPIVRTLQNLSLPASRHRWITGACFIDSDTGSEGQSFLVCGDKNGSVFLYPFVEECCDSASVSNIEPTQSFLRVHGKTGVTSVCERGGSVFTTGRDGFYREWKLQKGLLVQLHGYKVLKGLDWIDQLDWINNDLQVYGFFSDHFVVWSVSQNQQLISIRCGGGHRSWGFWRQDDKSRFVYLKNGEACVVDCGSHSKQSLLHPALHGREICDVKFLPAQRDVAPILCSASEDTSIMVSIFRNQDSLTVWTPLAVLKGHLSSVRALAVCSHVSTMAQPMNRTENYFQSSCLLFSGGGRAEIRAWKLNIQNSEDAKLLNTENSESSILEPSHLLLSSNKSAFSNSDTTVSISKLSLKKENVRNELFCQHEHLSTYFLGESRHKTKHSSWKTKKLKLDPETRIMSVHASPLHELMVLKKSCLTKETQELASAENNSGNVSQSHLYILSIAGSDGYLRILSFDERTRDFHTLASTFYHKCCVLKTLHYIHRTHENQTFPLMLSASTRGDIAIWNLFDVVSEHLIREAEEQKDEGQDFVDFLAVSVPDSVMETADTGDIQPILDLKAHQSGINSLHILQISESNALVASGGDDNSITVHNLLISGSQCVSVAKGTKVDAHSAQITGIQIVSPSIMLSTSIDQRVSIWQLCLQADSIEVKMISCKYIDIADVSCMDVLHERNTIRLCVAGEGMCLLEFELGNM